ncbi:MAG TPA: VWA domain-containing protein [Verrucomicrobiae bacterium]|jgi:VWFA-related protein|nr:VWA domain-containing protein [Verrucomicrobiae bacterium]
MERASKRRLCAATLIALLVFCAKSIAQQPSDSNAPPPPQATTQDKPVDQTIPLLRTTTRLVVVDVVALDAAGKPVTDIKAQDFKLLEEGKEQDVRVFSFHQPETGATTADRPRPAPNVFTNSPEFRGNSSFNVILIDAVNTAFENQAYARQQILLFLKKMPSNQPVAIYAMVGQKVQLLQDFTTDPVLLQSGVQKFKGAIPMFLNRAGSVPGRLAGPMQRVAQDQIQFRAEYTVGALGYIAQHLSGYPGRKNLIWISEAFPFDITPDFQIAGTLDSRTFSEQVTRAADALINSQVAIYPVDPRGLAAPAAFDASNRGSGSGSGLLRQLNAESAAYFAAHGTMNEMANRTGGRSFYNRNDIAASIRQSIDDGSTYYTLGYYPDGRKWDGTFRKIRVTVAKPGVKLHYRLGYYASDPNLPPPLRIDPKKRDVEFAQNLNLQVPSSRSIVFQAGVLPRSSQDQNKVPISFVIDPRAVNFQMLADGVEHAVVVCGVRVYSDKGKPVRLQETTITADLKPETYEKTQKTGIPCRILLDLPNGKYQMRLGVMDQTSGLTGTTNATVNVQ